MGVWRRSRAKRERRLAPLAREDVGWDEGWGSSSSAAETEGQTICLPACSGGAAARLSHASLRVFRLRSHLPEGQMIRETQADGDGRVGGVMRPVTMDGG